MSSLVTGSLACPALSTTNSSARGQARWSVQALAIGAWKSKRPFTP
ncbi:MAG: hypothetical protein OXH96_04940 [Spirochaetaceae bacterium]|nr:hypothetical protein [Spirochaetaceae bacterium]